MAARRIAALLATLLLAGPAGAQTADLVTRTALRVCADPANTPFSHQSGDGFENRIAELLAGDLGVPLEYTWFPQATGFVRNTLGAKRCDVVLGYAAGADPVQNTNPYYRSSWVLVTRKDGAFAEVERLDDPRLAQARLGVVGGTPPATLMAMNGLMGLAKSYPLVVDRRYTSPAEEMIADISAGTLDGGILWGPIGGYYASRASAPLLLVPLTKERSGPPMAYRITFGLRANEPDWKHRLNEFIAARQNEINRILLDYGVPLLDEQDRLITAGK